MATLKRNLWPVIAALLFVPGQSQAAEIKGTVRAIAGGTATVATEGDLLPNPGDKADIFFVLPGNSAEISVASGSVAKGEGDGIRVKVENATGEVAKDQLVRIVSDHPSKKTISLVGRWTFAGPDGKAAANLTFKADGTAAFDAPDGQGLSFDGNYTFDAATKPPRFEITHLRITPPASYSEEERKAFWDELKKKMDAQGMSLKDIEDSVSVGEVDGPTQFRFTQFKNRGEVPQGGLGPGALIFTRTP